MAEAEALRAYYARQRGTSNTGASTALRNARLRPPRSAARRNPVSDPLLALLPPTRRRTGPTMRQVYLHQVGIPRSAMRNIIDRRPRGIPRVAEDDPGWLNAWIQRARKPA